MKKPLLRGILRIAAFCLCLLLFLIAADFLLVQTDSITAITITEMKQRDDIQLAVVGSSVVRDHFNEALITEETGMESFSVAVAGSGFQTFTAMTEELYKTSSPEIVALVIEPYNFDTAREDPMPSYKTMPWLTGIGTRLRYYISNTRTDGYWIDRALIFRDFGAESFADIKKTISFHLDPYGTFAAYQDTLKAEHAEYMGAGFLRHNVAADLSTVIRQQMLGEPDGGYDYPLLEESKEMMLAFRDLVVSHGSRLLVIISDNHTSHALAEPDYLRYIDHVEDFCAENGMECYNLFYAKEELLPNLDNTFYDLYHMTGEGADQESHAFARIINAVRAGEDISGWFYHRNWEYKETVTWIVNTWVHPKKKGTFTAGCNTGSMVHPEYRFVLLDADGNETLLRDYEGGKDGAVIKNVTLPENTNLRVYARLQEHPEQEPVWFDYPDDYGYAAAHQDLYR